jgi:hypothetical protein
MSWAVDCAMRDARGSAKRVMVGRFVERRPRVADELLSQRDSLGRRRCCLHKGLGEQVKFMRRCPHGAAGDRHSSAPPRRPVRVAHRGFESYSQSTPPLRRRDVRGAYLKLRIPRRIRPRREEPVERPAS